MAVQDLHIITRRRRRHERRTSDARRDERDNDEERGDERDHHSLPIYSLVSTVGLVFCVVCVKKNK